MKTTSSKKTLLLVNRLTKISKLLKSLNDQTSNIKTELKKTMAEFDTNVLACGDHVLIISERTRNDLNKDMVKKLLGDKYSDCMTQCDYQIFEIKKA